MVYASRQAKAQPNATCTNCHMPMHKAPYDLKLYTLHFCSPECRATWHANHPQQEQGKWLELTCSKCGKFFQRKVSQAKLRKKTYCSQRCYWNDRRTYASCYWIRDVDQAPKQRLVHFLAAHSVGSYGKPGFETIIIRAKNGFYNQEPNEACNPMSVLAHDLREIGHTRLAQMVEDGSWQNQDEWPATRNTAIIHAHKSKLPWESQW